MRKIPAPTASEYRPSRQGALLRFSTPGSVVAVAAAAKPGHGHGYSFQPLLLGLRRTPTTRTRHPFCTRREPRQPRSRRHRHPELLPRSGFQGTLACHDNKPGTAPMGEPVGPCSRATNPSVSWVGSAITSRGDDAIHRAALTKPLRPRRTRAFAGGIGQSTRQNQVANAATSAAHETPAMVYVHRGAASHDSVSVQDRRPCSRNAGEGQRERERAHDILPKKSHRMRV